MIRLNIKNANQKTTNSYILIANCIFSTGILVTERLGLEKKLKKFVDFILPKYILEFR